jgi:NAD kinase
VLGGDGTMLRALARFLGTDVPRDRRQLRPRRLPRVDRSRRARAGLARVFAGDYRVVELPTLEVELDGERARRGQRRRRASATLGRMVELGWAIGGEDLGTQPCDGMICATPSGSTAYNLSNGGPVLVWGLDAMAVTFIAPHSLHARPLVVPRGLDLVCATETPDVAATVLVDGHRSPRSAGRRRGRVRLGDSAACSRRCRRRRSSAATARRSALGREGGGVPADASPRRCRRAVPDGRPDGAAPLRVYHPGRAAPLRIENLVLIREAELELRARAERDHRRDRRRQDDPRAGDRAAARREGRRGAVGAAGDEAYVEAELDLPPALSTTTRSSALASCGPRTRTGLVLARRVFADGRTRAYAWGRSARARTSPRRRAR